MFKHTVATVKCVLVLWNYLQTSISPSILLGGKWRHRVKEGREKIYVPYLVSQISSVALPLDGSGWGTSFADVNAPTAAKPVRPWQSQRVSSGWNLSGISVLAKWQRLSVFLLTIVNVFWIKPCSTNHINIMQSGNLWPFVQTTVHIFIVKQNKFSWIARAISGVDELSCSLSLSLLGLACGKGHEGRMLV